MGSTVLAASANFYRFHLINWIKCKNKTYNTEGQLNVSHKNMCHLFFEGVMAPMNGQ